MPHPQRIVQSIALLAAATILPFVATDAQAALLISSAATSNVTCSGGVCSPTATRAVLNVDDLENLLASGNVTVNTGTGNIAKQVKSIVVRNSFGWASASTLTLDAHESITFNKPVVDSGAGGLTLVTNDGGSGGVLSFGSGGRGRARPRGDGELQCSAALDFSSSRACARPLTRIRAVARSRFASLSREGRGALLALHQSKTSHRYGPLV